MAKSVVAPGERGELLEEKASRSALSVCCLTTGRSPARLAATLRLLRPVADEIVIALDDTAREVAPTLAEVADRILLFSPAEPADRQIAWLCGECRGDWIFNIDDDEIPSGMLVRALPLLVGRNDVTHCWIARRWLFPDVTTYLDESPWNAEYQLRLFMADERVLRFTDQFHRPIACNGPMRFVAAPLWHLDTALSSRDERERKALRYERLRRGMRIGAFSHNTGFYLPELRGDLAVQPVPRRDLQVIERVLRARPRSGGHASVDEPTPAAVDRAWPGAPHTPSLYESSITLLAAPQSFTAAVQETLDVRIKNLGDATWRRGDHAITVGTRWNDRVEGLRTSLPADVRPGESSVVPVHVLPPDEPGRHVLEVDLVHEQVRWFDRPLRLDVDVVRRRRVLVVGPADQLGPILDSVALVPDIEPLVVLEPDDPGCGLPRIEGIGRRLFGSDGTDGWRALPRAVALALRPPAAQPFARALSSADCLIILNDDVRSGAPPTRDRLRTLTMIRAARTRGVPVWRIGVGRPPSSFIDRLLQHAVAAGALSVSAESLTSLLGRI
jgi:hypothetical protein